MKNLEEIGPPASQVTLIKSIASCVAASYVLTLIAVAGKYPSRSRMELLTAGRLAAIFLCVAPLGGLAWGISWYATRRLRVGKKWRHHASHLIPIVSFLFGLGIGAAIIAFSFGWSSL